MAQLVVRKVEDAVVKTLRRRAAERGVSMEEEHRRILRASLLRGARERGDLKSHLDRMPDVGSDEDFARRPSRRRRVNL
jgi:plasmid stability protein